MSMQAIIDEGEKYLLHAYNRNNVIFAGWSVLLTLLYRCGVLLRKGKVRTFE